MTESTLFLQDNYKQPGYIVGGISFLHANYLWTPILPYRCNLSSHSPRERVVLTMIQLHVKSVLLPYRSTS